MAGTPLVCDDGDVCNGAETCDPATGCVAGTPLVCDDGNECTDDVCDPVDGCVYTWNMACDAAYCDEFKDPTSGELIFDVAGLAAQNAAALFDTDGEYSAYYADYYSVDLNEDGIADRTQLALLAQLLCLDLCVEHPTIDLDAVRRHGP